MKKVSRWKMFWLYILPHFINKHIRHIAATDKAYDLVDYCCKVIREGYEPQTYAETMFEEKLTKDGGDRVEQARVFLCATVPYCDFDWRAYYRD